MTVPAMCMSPNLQSLQLKPLRKFYRQSFSYSSNRLTLKCWQQYRNPGSSSSSSRSMIDKLLTGTIEIRAPDLSSLAAAAAFESSQQQQHPMFRQRSFTSCEC